MTDEQYDKAYKLKSEISSLRGLIEFVNSPNVRVSLGQEEYDDEPVIIPLEEIYTLDRDVHSKLLEICITAREEFLTYLKEKLEESEREFNYV